MKKLILLLSLMIAMPGTLPLSAMPVNAARKAAAKERRAVSLVAKARPAAMPNKSAHVPGFHLPPGQQ